MFKTLFSKRMILATIAIVGVLVLALAVMIDTSSAQGPGGSRGRGQGNQGSGNRGGQQGQMGMYQTQPYQDENCLYGCPQAGFGGQGYGANGQGGLGLGLNLTNLPPAVPGLVPADVVDALTAGLMDEYNAYATYQAVIDQFGAVAPFVNIQASEAQHIAALQFLFERYDLPVPAAPAQVDVPQFATLAEACAAAQAAEIANANLYDQWLATVQTYPDATQVFAALQSASLYQHLPAFERCSVQ